MSNSEIEYQPGDCVVEHLGQIKLADGRIFHGVVMTFPISPPKLPITVVWDRTPITMSVREAIDVDPMGSETDQHHGGKV